MAQKNLPPTELSSVESREQAKENTSEPQACGPNLEDPRFDWKHGLLVFTGVVTREEIQDPRILREDRVDALLRPSSPDVRQT